MQKPSNFSKFMVCPNQGRSQLEASATPSPPEKFTLPDEIGSLAFWSVSKKGKIL